MGYGYTSNARYEAKRTQRGSQITFTIEPVSFDRPYVKSCPCPDDFMENENEAIACGMSLGAYIRDRLVGIIVARPREWNNTLWIEDFQVNAAYRRMGIGALLMQGAEDIARRNNFRIIGLETQNTNAPAIAFYMKMGFELDGLDVSYYSNNEGLRDEIAFFMKKHLGP